MSIEQIKFIPSENFEPAREKTALVFLVITKEEVMSCAVGPATDVLMKMSESRESVIKFENSLVLTFDGWNDDPREIFEIPEVRNYAKKLFNSWNHWFHFAFKKSETLKNLTSLLLDIEVVRDVEGVGYMFKSATEGGNLIHQYFNGLNRLHDLYEIPFIDNVRISNEAIESLNM